MVSHYCGIILNQLNFGWQSVVNPALPRYPADWCQYVQEYKHIFEIHTLLCMLSSKGQWDIFVIKALGF